MEQRQGILSWQLQKYITNQKNEKRSIPSVDFLD